MPRSLTLRIALPVLGFAVAGSLVIAVCLHVAAQRESRTLFATLARTNADFVREARLPGNEQVARDLGRVLGMRVFFRHGAWEVSAKRGGRDQFALRQGTELVPAIEGDLARERGWLGALAQEQGIVRTGAGAEAIAVPVRTELSMIFVRPAQGAPRFLLRPETLAVLGALWAASLALGWAIARGVVRPLRQLAERLPELTGDVRPSLPSAERDDEIGHLARTILAARELLAGERVERLKSERLALLGRMATGLAHEIHNPLAAIRLHAQLLESTDACELPTAARDTLPLLLEETARIESLVSQWMFLARPVPPQTSPTDLAALVGEIARSHAPLAAHAGVNIEVRAASPLCAAVDGRRITQAIRNVLVNAVQAMPGGGVLTISGERAARHVRLVFRDTGPGFSVAALAHFADLFFSEKEGGMGIGLAVSTEIIRAHGGTLSVENADAGGAEVTFSLPTNDE